MAHVIVDLPAASRREQALDPKALSREVWRHEQLARERQLHPVVELYSHKSKVSKRLTKLWQSKTELQRDTLEGIYLIRVNLMKHRPEAVLALTQRVVLGIPLLVAWNSIGQVLSPRELAGFEESELEIPLSAFFEDVTAGKPFRLTPPEPGAAGATRVAEQVEGASPPSEEHSDAGVVPLVQALSQQLDEYVEAARQRAVEYLTQHALLFDLTLESLVELDVHLAEHDDFRGSDAERSGAVQQLAAALAVYFGQVVCGYAEAGWYVDTTRTSLTEALRLRVIRGEQTEDVAPALIVMDALEVPSRTLFGSAVELCGLLEGAQR